MTVEKISFNNRPKGTGILTLEKALSQIKTLGLTEEVLVKLINKLRKMPPGSYSHFLQNIDYHITSLN